MVKYEAELSSMEAELKALKDKDNSFLIQITQQQDVNA